MGNASTPRRPNRLAAAASLDRALGMALCTILAAKPGLGPGRGPVGRPAESLRFIPTHFGRIRRKDRPVPGNPDGSITLPSSVAEAPGFWGPWKMLVLRVRVKDTPKPAGDEVHVGRSAGVVDSQPSPETKTRRPSLAKAKNKKRGRR